MMSTIEKLGTSCGWLSVVAAEGDDTTTIAHLAQFTPYDVQDAYTQDTSAWCVAAQAIRDEWSFELVDCVSDYYDGFTATFKDGSKLKFVSTIS